MEKDDLDRLRAGGSQREAALGDIFDRERPRLRRMLQIRMDARLRDRIDASDVLQEAFLEATQRLEAYLRDPGIPFHLWLRFLADQQLVTHHRRHLGAQRRDVSRQRSIHGGEGSAEVSSVVLADLLQSADTTPTGALARAEVREQLLQALDAMSPLDREILVLRHFEQLSNGDVARMLGISKTTASNRYVRALSRMSGVLGNVDGTGEGGTGP